MNHQTETGEMEIDILRLVKLLWKKLWIIAIVTVLAGALGFSYSAFLVTPMYQSSAMMYVNNSSFTVGSTSFSISSGELSAAKSLLDTYVVILKTRTTLEEVIREAELDYTYEELDKMVSAASVSSTEVFRVTVTAPDPVEAELIVRTIVDILPDRISEIVDGSSVRIVDTAIVPTRRSSPSHTKNAMIGMALGLVLSCGVIVVMDLLNNTIRDEDYLTEVYGLPMLAIVPDMNAKHHGKYGYYKYGDYSYYGRKAENENEGGKTR